jgi:hypothetical protein
VSCSRTKTAMESCVMLECESLRLFGRSDDDVGNSLLICDSQSIGLSCTDPHYTTVEYCS